MANELAILTRWARALESRRTHPGPSLPLLRAATLGERLSDRGRAHAPAWLAAAVALEPRTEEPLLPPEADLDACRKPFQLWNVHREVRDEPFALEEAPELKLGPLIDEVVPPRPTITPSPLELYLLETHRAGRWAAQSVDELRRNRRQRIRHGRPNHAPPPVIESASERGEA